MHERVAPSALVDLKLVRFLRDGAAAHVAGAPRSASSDGEGTQAKETTVGQASPD